MRFAVVSLVALLAAGCGAAPRERPAGLQSPSTADATRAQWYDTVRRSGADDAQPALSESDVTRAVRDGAQALGMKAVTVHYLPVQGGAADIIVEPADPVSFADHPGGGITTLLGPLGHNDRAYLVTVVEALGAPLFVLGWMPNAGQGERIAWQAPGIRSDAVFGRPDTSNNLLQNCRGADPCSVMAPTK